MKTRLWIIGFIGLMMVSLTGLELEAWSQDRTQQNQRQQQNGQNEWRYRGRGRENPFAGAAVEAGVGPSDVVNDRRFEHIQEHLNYTPMGLVITPPGRQYYGEDMPAYTRYDRMWIEILIQGRSPEEHLPEDWRDLIFVGYPARAAQMTEVMRTCDTRTFRIFMDDYNQYLHGRFQGIMYSTQSVERWYHTRYLWHRDRFREAMGLPASTWDQTQQAYDFVSGIRDMFEVIDTGASTANPIAATWDAVNYAIEALTGIVSSIEAKGHAIQALASLKMYLFYRDQVVPYLSAIDQQMAATRNESDRIFSERYCWACECFYGESEHPTQEMTQCNAEAHAEWRRAHPPNRRNQGQTPPVQPNTPRPPRLIPPPSEWNPIN